MRYSFTVALLLALAGLAVPATAQNSVDGRWALTFETPMGMLDASADFQSEGEELSGTMESQAGSTGLKGSVKGNAITFSMNVVTPQGEMLIQLTGEVAGDDIKGTFDFGQGVGTWTGTRVKSAR